LKVSSDLVGQPAAAASRLTFRLRVIHKMTGQLLAGK
jgi:hypothetical protein